MARTLIVNVLIALVAAAAGFGLYRYVIAPRQQDAASKLVPMSEPEPRPSVQPTDTLPDFTLTDRNGQPTSIRSWTGKSLIVNFWATWCAPCRKEIPLLIATQKARAEQGFQVVGIAVDDREQVLKYADEINIDYPVLIGEQDGLDALTAVGVGTPVFPVTAFTDDQNRVVAIYPGELNDAKLSVILDAVSKVNRGEQSPTQARIAIGAELDRLEHSEGSVASPSTQSSPAG